MSQRIGEVRQAYGDCDLLVRKLNQMSETLQTEWHGQASAGFAEQYSRLRSQAFEPMLRLLDDLGCQMTETLNVIQELDSQMHRKFSS